MQYYHGEHGIHISYNPGERTKLEGAGWTLIGGEKAFLEYRNGLAPSDGDRALELNDMNISELKDIAEGYGLSIHSRAKEASIIKKILEAEA